MSFSGKSVLVTGASGGIGGCTALLFAERGADVAVHYNSRRGNALKVAGQINRLSRKSIVVKADVSKPKEAEGMVDEVIQSFGKLDVLVNNAALHPPPMFSLKEPDWDYWRRMMETNVMGVIACSRAAAPHLRETGGCIVNVVMDWDAGGIDYTLTKAAGTPLTRGLAREFAPIRVNAVSPGAVDTWGMTEDEKAYWIERTLLKRVGEPGDIAGPVLFLASDEAQYITGATLQVDGETRLLV
jgi:NAD(P)-dependent dehydrogenase (short-subunit alcohol dehydrogenase family)